MFWEKTNKSLDKIERRLIVMWDLTNGNWWNGCWSWWLWGEGVWNLPLVGMSRRAKVPKVPRRLGGEEVFTSSERVRGTERAVGGTADVDASGWVDIFGKRRFTTCSFAR